LLKLLSTEIKKNPHLKNIIANIGWLFVDRILRIGLGLLVVTWMARYFGPEKFGLFSFAVAFVALFSSIASLGLSSIVVRDLVNKSEGINVTLGTAFFLQIVGSGVAICLSVLVISVMRPDDVYVKYMVAILSFVMMFKSTDVVKYWFESNVRSKYTVWVESSVFVFLAIIKLGLIFFDAPLIAFVWTVFVEGLLMAAGLLIIYSLRVGQLNDWQWEFQRAQVLLKDSWPLILSGLAVMVYMRIDQVMLGQMLGDEAVGVYTAAVRISEAWYFIPIAIVASVFPGIIEAKKNQEKKLYHKKFQHLYSLMVLLALAIALPITFLSDQLVVLLFGNDYIDASIILKIHAWGGVFVFLGLVSGKWYLLEDLSTYLFKRTLVGAVVNLVLNIWLIPKYGLVGAAVATLISFSVAGFWFDVVYKKTRPIFYMKLDAVLLRGLYVR